MKAIIIYGPPGVGKMTVAKELVKITNVKYLPHNLILDLIMPIISEDIGDGDLWDLYEKIKLDIIRSSKKKKSSIVLTEVYNSKVSDKRFKKFLDELKKLDVDPCFVKLSCKKEELHKRVSAEDRKFCKKINEVKKLEKMMGEEDLDSEISFVESLVVENTDRPAKEVAEDIKEKFRLGEK